MSDKLTRIAIISTDKVTTCSLLYKCPANYPATSQEFHANTRLLDIVQAEGE